MEIELTETRTLIKEKLCTIVIKEFYIEIKQCLKDKREINIKIEDFNNKYVIQNFTWIDINKKLIGEWKSIQIYSDKEMIIYIYPVFEDSELLEVEVKVKEILPLYNEQGIKHFIFLEEHKYFIHFAKQLKDLHNERLRILTNSFINLYKDTHETYIKYIVIPNGFIEGYLKIKPKSNIYKRNLFPFCLIWDYYNSNLILGIILENYPVFTSTWESIGIQIPLENIVDSSVKWWCNHEEFEVVNPEEYNSEDYLYKIIER